MTVSLAGDCDPCFFEHDKGRTFNASDHLSSKRIVLFQSNSLGGTQGQVPLSEMVGWLFVGWDYHQTLLAVC